MSYKRQIGFGIKMEWRFVNVASMTTDVNITSDTLTNVRVLRWKAKGFLCLSTIRIVFVKDNRSQSGEAYGN